MPTRPNIFHPVTLCHIFTVDALSQTSIHLIIVYNFYISTVWHIVSRALKDTEVFVQQKLRIFSYGTNIVTTHLCNRHECNQEDTTCSTYFNAAFISRHLLISRHYSLSPQSRALKSNCLLTTDYMKPHIQTSRSIVVQSKA